MQAIAAQTPPSGVCHQTYDSFQNCHVDKKILCIFYCGYKGFLPYNKALHYVADFLTAYILHFPLAKYLIRQLLPKNILRGNSMYQRIHDALYRQKQAIALLVDLLEEEYDLLRQRDTQAVVALEFAIQELVRQLAKEKVEVIAMLDGGKVRHYVELLPAEQGQLLMEYYKAIDNGEQQSARKASRNAQLSLALLDQSQRIMNELHSQIVPQDSSTYGRRGALKRYATQRPQAAIISGRL